MALRTMATNRQPTGTEGREAGSESRTAISIDEGLRLSHIPMGEFPAQELSYALYKHAGVRSCESGSVMCGKSCDDGCETSSTNEFMRL